MRLEHQIREDWKEALRAGNTRRKLLLSMTRAELLNEKLRVGYDDLSDDEVRGVLHKMIEQRKETIASISGRHMIGVIAKEALDIMALDQYLVNGGAKR